MKQVPEVEIYRGRQIVPYRGVFQVVTGVPQGGWASLAEPNHFMRRFALNKDAPSGAIALFESKRSAKAMIDEALRLFPR